MIKNFKHKGLEKYFTKADLSLLNKKQLPRIKRILMVLDSMTDIQGLDIPGYGLHPLTGNRKGTWSVKVSGNWRITFKFEEGNAFDVNLEDYH